MNSFFRKIAWRIGRKIYCWARRDLSNNPFKNGEFWLLDKVLNNSSSKNILFDIGANKGDWSLQAIKIAKKNNVNLNIVAFEPCSSTRQKLLKNTALYQNITVSDYALSSQSGNANFFYNEIGAGTNSLSEISGSKSEIVKLISLDQYISKSGNSNIKMVKIDTEGFDCNVLKGAKKTLVSGKIEIIQFEYNWRWLINYSSLKDVFNLIQDTPYVFGKLTEKSIEFYTQWHFELDRFFENNYVLIHKDCHILNDGIFVKFDKYNAISLKL